MESRTQGSRPRPRTQKKSEAKDSLFEDRTSRGQGQECSRPRPRNKDTSASVLQKKKKKKKVFTKIFQAISTKKRFPKNFSSVPQNFNNSRNSAVLEPRRERERLLYLPSDAKAKKKTDTLQNHTSVVRKKHHIFPNFSSVSSRDTDSSYVQKSGISSAPRKCVVMITLSWIQISYTLFL